MRTVRCRHIAITLVGLLMLTACANSTRSVLSPTPLPLADRPISADDVRPVVFFTDLATMVATSTLVIIGEVTAIEVIGHGGQDENVYEIRRVTVDVVDVLAGQVLGSATVALEEDGIAYPFSLVGDRGVYFLHKRQDRVQPTYRPVNFQGLLLDDGTGGIQPSGHGDPLLQRLESLSVDEVVSEIDAAVDAIIRGEVTPAAGP